MELKTFEKELVYNGEKVRLFLGKYIHPANNALFMETMDGDPHATCSINLETEIPVGEDLIFIKDYSENEGMTDFLLKNGVIEQIIGSKQSGYIYAPVAKLALNKFIEIKEDECESLR